MAGDNQHTVRPEVELLLSGGGKGAECVIDWRKLVSEIPLYSLDQETCSRGR